MGVISWNQAVDIGGGRGRLAPEAAASLARVDVAMRSAFGRAADINEAWRSPEDADKNYAAYQAYLRDPKRNPWAPIALPGDKSVHCFGYAVDTDDTSDAQMRIWNEHGWYWTVYRDGKLVERWHLEYFRDRDKHRNDPAYSNAKPFEEDDMYTDEDRKRDQRIASFIDDLKPVVMNGEPGIDLSKGRLDQAISAVLDLRNRFVVDADGDGAKDYDLTQLTANEIKPMLLTLLAAIGRPSTIPGAPIDVSALAAAIREGLPEEIADELGERLGRGAAK